MHACLRSCALGSCTRARTLSALLSAGNYGALRKAGKKDKAKTHMEMLAAVKNYR